MKLKKITNCDFLRYYQNGDCCNIGPSMIYIYFGIDKEGLFITTSLMLPFSVTALLMIISAHHYIFWSGLRVSLHVCVFV